MNVQDCMSYNGVQASVSTGYYTLHIVGCLYAADPLQNVINQFTRIAQDPRVSFFGNVCVGKDVTVEELRRIYSLVSKCTWPMALGRTCNVLCGNFDKHDCTSRLAFSPAAL